MAVTSAEEKPKMASMRDAYGETLVRLGSEMKDIVVIGADTTGSIKTSLFGAKFPARFFNVGIAEQNLVSVAAGLAMAGKIAFASTYAVFAPGKCVDPIRNAIAYPETKRETCRFTRGFERGTGWRFSSGIGGHCDHAGHPPHERDGAL